MYQPTIKYLCFSIFSLLFTPSYAQILCEDEVPFSTNSAYIQFEESALIIDDTTYFGDDLFINALYKDKELGMQCSGFIRYNKGLPFTMSLTGRDAFVSNGFSIGDGIFLVLQKEDGCILDSLQITLAGNTEITDSLIFETNKVFRIQRLEAKRGDCLLTSTIEKSFDNFLNIYPNPTSSDIQIELQLPKFQPLQYRLLNSIGQEVKRGIWEGSFIRRVLDLSSLPPNTYHLVIYGGEEVISRKIILLR